MASKPMNEAISRAVDEWLSSRALSDLANDGFAQADIDEFFEPSDPVGVGRHLLRVAMARVKPSYADVIAMLVVPLPATPDLVVSAPNFSGAASAPWKYGPGREVVGLYLLLRPWLMAVDEPGEEYRCHVDAGEALRSESAVYFRSWRSHADAARGWEFNQAFYICAQVGNEDPGGAESKSGCEPRSALRTTR
jgi:hypothetical protein